MEKKGDGRFTSCTNWAASSAIDVFGSLETLFWDIALAVRNLSVCLRLLFAIGSGLQLPRRKHYSALDFLTCSALVGTNPTDEPMTSSWRVILFERTLNARWNPLRPVPLHCIFHYGRDTGAQAGVPSSHWLSVNGRWPEPSAFITKSSP
jgi:hypothetical protein